MKKIIATVAIAALAAVAVPSQAQADTRPVPSTSPFSTTWVRGTQLNPCQMWYAHRRLQHVGSPPYSVRRSLAIRYCGHSAPFPPIVRHVEIQWPTPR